jgi:glycosyltransferase involved in cell wall biosynthesis
MDATIHRILDKVRAVDLPHGIQKELIVVNDCSKDNTEEAILNYQSAHPDLPIQYLKHAVNTGPGAARHTGIAAATGDYIVIQDADLEYDPEEYKLLLAPVLAGHADVVYGSRFMGGNAHRILFFWHSIGNKMLTFMSNATTNLNLTDMETCYKLFRSEIIQNLPLKEKRFGFEPEVTARIARVKGVRIYEVGISYYGRTYEEGKKIGWRDGPYAQLNHTGHRIRVQLSDTLHHSGHALVQGLEQQNDFGRRFNCALPTIDGFHARNQVRARDKLFIDECVSSSPCRFDVWPSRVE